MASEGQALPVGEPEGWVGTIGAWRRATSPIYQALGYLLFYAWPFAFRLAGFGLAESMLLCAAVINIHHFVVDRYIWRLRKDINYRVVTGG